MEEWGRYYNTSTTAATSTTTTVVALLLLLLQGILQWWRWQIMVSCSSEEAADLMMSPIQPSVGQR